jgi:hypothetical protein
MATNISKYLQLNDFILLEYEFNKDGETTMLTTPSVAVLDASTLYFYEGDGAIGETNNILSMNSVPTTADRTLWYFDPETPEITYPSYWDSSIAISTASYPLDTIKLHIVSGYNFDDIDGILLQVRAESSTGSLVDLANFTYARQVDALSGNVIKFAVNTLFLGNKFYDKYIEFAIPSIQALGNNSPATNLGNTLQIKPLSDVYLTYSTIPNIINNQFVLQEQTFAQLPVTSVADNFNCFIAESTSGDYIEYYASWNGQIIGDYIGEIESGRIKIYTSNNPNDNYEEFRYLYGINAKKWVIIHEILVYEHIPVGTSLLTHKYSFTQEDNFSLANYFRPILRHADLASSYTIQYTCRLTNRMDGTQIIRKASFSSSDPKKYGLNFTRINVENLLPYKVFNRLEAEKPNIIVNNPQQRTKFVKVFYDTTTVVTNVDNELFPSGTGPLFLKDFDSVYKFKFERITDKGDRENVDLSGAYLYSLVFKLDNGNKIEVDAYFDSDNTITNTTLGELAFKLSEDQLFTIKKQKNNNFSIIIKNPNGAYTTFYSGVFYDISDEAVVMANYKNMYSVTDMQAEIANLKAEVNRLTEENNILKTT